MTFNSPRTGALWILFASLMFASMSALIRSLAGELDNNSVVFYRNFFGLVVILTWWLRMPDQGVKTQRLPLHILRSTTGLIAMYCFFYALGKLTVAEAVLLNFSAPLFIPLFALLLIRNEKVKPAFWIAVTLGFIGIALILQPQSQTISTDALIGACSGIFAGFAMVTVRKLGSSEPASRTVLYYGVICTLISLIPYLYDPVIPTGKQLLTLVFIGLFATMGQFALTHGYRYAPAAQIGPFMYFTVVFATLYGWLFWQEFPDLLSVTGGILVVIAGVIAIRSEKLRHKTNL